MSNCPDRPEYRKPKNPYPTPEETKEQVLDRVTRRQWETRLTEHAKNRLQSIKDLLGHSR